MRGFGRPDFQFLAFPAEEPPSIECNEDAGEEDTDELTRAVLPAAPGSSTGSVARDHGPPSRRARDGERAVTHLDAIGQAGQTRPTARVGAAEPSSRTSIASVPSPVRQRTRARLAPACLTTLVSASATMKYAVASTSAGAAPP